MSDFVHEEGALAEQWGLPREVLRLARKKMARGADWALEQGAVRFSAAGREALYARVAPAGNNGAPAAAAETAPVAGRVVRTFLNPHLVELALADGRRVRARVRTTEHLAAGAAGTILLVRTTASGMWELAQRLPRSAREARRGTAVNGRE